MLIAQISDLHLSSENTKTFDVAPMSENLKKCIQHINQLPSQPDLVLVTGDISNNGELDELLYAKTILDELKIPYYVIPGNHDNRHDLLTVFGENSCSSNSDQLINYAINDYDIRLIGLDTSIANKSGGQFTQSSYEWLQDQLQQSPDQPTLLFMHHPPVNVGITETNIDGFEGKELLAKVLKNHHNIEAILCGHIHLSTHTRWQGSMINTCPSIGMRLVIDFSMQNNSQYTLDDPSYQLHKWTNEQNLITFDVNVTDQNQGHPFY